MVMIDEYGCEFYAGEAALIVRACAEGRWGELRSGVAADAFVRFPRCVHGLDLLLLSAAIANSTRRPEVVLSESVGTVAGDEGTWGADVLPGGWVESVAAVQPGQVGAVWQYWVALHEREYGEDEEWDSPAVAVSLSGLVSLCQQALAGSREVIWVWTQ
jgi:hypothetical protein